jgi:hypothetical protein
MTPEGISMKKILRLSAVAACAALSLPHVALAIAPMALFSYTGHEQSYVVPSGVALEWIAVDGGHGGQPGGEAGGEGGGTGGGVGAMLPVTPGEKLFVELGSAGVYNGGAVVGGGGAGGAPPPVLGSQGGVYASSGGGASDVRMCSMSAASCPGGVSSAATRLLVAGGGGGAAGGGNSNAGCPASGFGAGADNFQYPPGNPASGPVPIITAAGIVYPGRSTRDAGEPGVTPAAGGANVAGRGGSQAGCTYNGVTDYDSVAGSNALGPVGGTGGDASSLAPNYATCGTVLSSCFDAGAGGGGGGGYFGGGGGATGTDKSSGNCGSCNGAGAGQGGGGGSSFISSQMTDQQPDPQSLSQWNGAAEIVPAIEIDTPANGAVYAPGQVLDASWACDPNLNCTGSVVNGGPVDTSLGKHSFTVSAPVYSNGPMTVHATVTYTVGQPGPGKRTIKVKFAGVAFKLSVQTACVTPGGKLRVSLSKAGSAPGYKLAALKYLVAGKSHSTTRTGSVALSVGRLAAGTHKLKLVIVLRSRKPHGKPKSKSIIAAFSVC